jgi:two-component system OmpR family response regulator
MTIHYVGLIMNKILIVDDDKTTREMVARILQKKGHEVVKAENGQEAWERLTVDSNYSCIIVDMAMPVMNGNQLVTLIRKHDALRSLPIIIVSGVFSFEEVEGLLLMAPELTFFISKPVDSILLDKYIVNLTKQKTEMYGIRS